MADEKIIWDYLYTKIGNKYGVAGLMGNLYAESGLISTNLQNTYNTKFGMTDEAYTKSVDNETYSNFVHDSGGYGLAQWTYWTRKQNLLNFAKASGKSIGDLNMQLNFLFNELSTGYKGVLNGLKSATSVREASDVVLTQFERPKIQNESVKVKRASYGQNYYNKYASTSSATDGSVVVSSSATNTTTRVDPAQSFVGSLKGTYTVTASKLNMRSGANTSSSIIQVLVKNTKVTCYGYYTETDGVKWLYVKQGTKVGFCSSKYLKKV